MGDGFRFEAYEGNTRVLTFYLRRFLDKQPWNVSAATQIYLESTDPTGVDIAPIPASPTAPGADWINGVVVVTIGPGDVNSQIGTWQAGLTLWIAGEETTADSGVIEVLNRPGFALP